MRELNLSEKAIASLGAIVLASAVFIACLDLSTATRYSDFIVGDIGWRGDSKLQDLLVLPVSTLTFVLFFLWWQRLLLRSRDRESLSVQVGWWCVPATLAISPIILDKPLDRSLFFVSVFGLLLMGLSLTITRRRGLQIAAQQISQLVLTLVFVALTPFVIALVAGRVWPEAAIGVRGAESASRALLVGGAFSLLGFMFVGTQVLLRMAPVLLVFAQGGLVFLFLHIFPAQLMPADGGIANYKTQPALWVLIGGLVVIGLADVLWRFRGYLRRPKDLGSEGHGSEAYLHLLSPMAAFALVLTFTIGRTVAPHVSSDDYHFGESLLGWWSYLRGAIPYLDFVSAHGFIDDDLRGFLSLIFFDGTAASIGEAGRVAFVLLGIVAFFALVCEGLSIAMASLAFYLLYFVIPPGAGLKWIFIVPFLCLWTNTKLFKRPELWLAFWIVSVPLLLLGVPPQGLVLAVATGPTVLYQAWKLWQGRARASWFPMLAALGSIIVLSLVFPIIHMIYGALRYVLENGPINQAAYGVPWNVSLNGPNGGKNLFEILRMSWLVVPLACCWVAIKQWRVHQFPAAASIGLFFSLLLVPYTMGRIDPGALSRAGVFSIFALAILLPLIAAPSMTAGRLVIFTLIVSGMLAPLNPEATPSILRTLRDSVAAGMGVGELKDGASAGIPNLGRGAVDSEQWKHLLDLKSHLDSKLSPGEPYLDLTGRHAQYFYLDRFVPLEVTAPYNMVSLSQQKRAVKILRAAPPRLSLMLNKPYNIIHDGGGLPLRNPVLYRFVLDHYVPRFDGGFIFGDLKHNAKQVNELGKVQTVLSRHQGEGYLMEDPVLLSLLRVGDQFRIVDSGDLRSVRAVTRSTGIVELSGGQIKGDEKSFRVEVLLGSRIEEYDARLLEKAFAVPDLSSLAISWGRSERSLLKRMTLVQKLTNPQPESGSQSANMFSVQGLNISGREADLLKLRFNCGNPSGHPRVRVEWPSGSSQVSTNSNPSVMFRVANGVVIVPLDANPRWSMARNVNELMFSVLDPGVCPTPSFENLELHKRLL